VVTRLRTRLTQRIEASQGQSSGARSTHRERVCAAPSRPPMRGGIGALTIRSLAQEVGVKPMSVYHHVANMRRTAGDCQRDLSKEPGTRSRFESDAAVNAQGPRSQSTPRPLVEAWLIRPDTGRAPNSEVLLPMNGSAPTSVDSWVRRRRSAIL